MVTVSRYINGASTVREYNRKKIQQAMDELNYTPSSAARTLSSGKTGIVGLLVSHISDNYINDIIYSINKALRKKRYYLALSVVEAGTENDYSYLFEKDRVDGIIIHTSYITDETLTKLKEEKVPVLSISGDELSEEFSTVVSDDYHGGYMVADYLIELGHKRISHISGPDGMISSRLRQKGFVDRLKKEGLEPISLLNGAYSVASGYKCAMQCLEKGDMPTAIFVADDQTAFGVMNAFKNHGISIPGDVSIVGYDDHPYSRELHPQLTTVSQPAKAIGEHAVEALFEQMKTITYKVNTKIKPELVIRESTRPMT